MLGLFWFLTSSCNGPIEYISHCLEGGEGEAAKVAVWVPNWYVFIWMLIFKVCLLFSYFRVYCCTSKIKGESAQKILCPYKLKYSFVHGSHSQEILFSRTKLPFSRTKYTIKLCEKLYHIYLIYDWLLTFVWYSLLLIPLIHPLLFKV